MIYEHEIPKGSRLYFSSDARLKRDIENKIVALLEKRNFEEIVIPNFSYYEHQKNINFNELIKIHDKENRSINLRADSTIDVTRLITKRLQSSTSNKKWFYVQPIFKFPTIEHHQIGVEDISNGDISSTIDLLMSILTIFNISPTFQLSSTKLPKLISKEIDISVNKLCSLSIDDILCIGKKWLSDIVYLNNIDDINNLDDIPTDIAEELKTILDIAKKFNLKNCSISPLYVSKIKYYDGVHFKLFIDNLVVAKGGTYKDNEITSSGFCIFIDNLIEILR